MTEQGAELRRWIATKGEEIRRQIRQVRPVGVRVLAVTSGKGGVGKSSLTLNLALTMARRGSRVTVLDADLGLANINILLGFNPEHTLMDVIDGDLGLCDITVPGPEGIRILPGGSGVSRLAALAPDQLERIVSGFQSLDDDCDWLLIDTGAGISPAVMRFVLSAHRVLVVTNPEPTALADAYGVVKTMWESGMRLPTGLVVNRIRHREEAELTGRRLIRLARRALDYPVEMMGAVHEDDNVSRAIFRQEPLVAVYPKTQAARDIEALAARILAVEPEGETASLGMRHFIRRLKETWHEIVE